MRGNHGQGVSLAATLVGMLAMGVSTHAAGPVLHVDDDAPSGGDGAAWSTAFRYLQDALAVASAGTVVRVAGGAHHPDRDESNPAGTGDRAASFVLGPGVTIEGGYLGLAAEKGEDPDGRNLGEHATFLSGDLAGDDGPSFTGRGENSVHVVRADTADAASRLDGVRIVAGHANGAAEPDRVGAGLFVASASPAIHECILESNLALDAGGAMFIDGGSALVTFSTFVENQAGVDEPATGGALYVEAADPTLDCCDFLRNRATDGGGGVSLVDASPRLTGCAFLNNRVVGPAIGQAAAGGGLIAVASAATLVDCRFLGNRADGGVTGGAGGAVAIADEPSPRLEECEFSGNQAAGLGGAAFTQSAAALFVRCIFDGNAVTIGAGGFALGGGVAHVGGSPATSGCVFTGNDTSRLGGAIYNALTDGDVTNSSFDANKAQEGGAVYNEGGTPVFRTCTFATNTAFGGAGLGGAVRNVGNDSLLDACTFTANEASVAGGALHVEPGATVTLRDDDFCDNVPDDVFGVFVDQGGNTFCPRCDADLDGDGVVTFGDLLLVLAAWGPCPGCPQDIDDSGVVDVADLLTVLRAWGPCP